MRLDLTQASFRVFDRASRYRLPNGLAEIGAAKLLIALFEEEECRAADWLAEAGLTLDAFQTAFGLKDETATLQSPISAPPFAVGSYGISPGQPQKVELGPQKMELGAADGDPPPFPPEYPGTEQPPIADEWVAEHTVPKSVSKTPHAAYSLFSDLKPSETFEPQRQSSLRFFLDDKPIRVGRLSADLESTLGNLVLQIGRRNLSKENRRPLPSPDAMLAIPNIETDYSSFSVPLATEHLLLAAVLDDGDVGRWLRDNGFDPTELLKRIEKHSNTDTKNPGFEQPTVQSRDCQEADIEESSTITETHEPRTTNHESRLGLSRLLDAVTNRASEAVRVIEDYVRFVLDDRSLTMQLKNFRHDFREAVRPFSNSERLQSRDTEQDVGTDLEGSGEYERRNESDVLASNFGRLQESLRSLEEFSKIGNPQVARRLEQLRYRSYTLHKNVFGQITEACSSGLPLSFDAVSTLRPSTLGALCGENLHEILDGSRLYVLLDAKPTGEEFIETVRKLIADGVGVIQLRDKTADDRTLLNRAEILRKSTRESERRVLFVMNDRPDLAKLSGADGVHVGQEELSVAQVREIVGDEMLVGVSTHDVEQARQAVFDGADYIGVGPVFPSSTKEFDEFPGLDFLRAAATEIEIPMFAIGGINLANLSDVLETGVRRVAIGSAAADAGEFAEKLAKK